MLHSDYAVSYPVWRYKRLVPVIGENIVNKELSPGHDYIIHGIVVKVPPRADLSDISSDVKISIFQPERGRGIIDEPVEIPLVSSPGNLNPNGRDTQIKYYHLIDYMFSFSDRLILKVTVAATGTPAYVDLLVFGRNVKREQLRKG